MVSLQPLTLHMDTESEVHLLKTQSCWNVVSLKPGIGQNIHVSPAAKNCTLVVSAFLAP